ncbi:hypothetical protein DOTSEDRAFT_68139 [Dothistroma septosporum NZE10]|uniref:Uncharacterized protein n=1 Tax=Dothistroma septosporum (strain NZE10 / CBS 128990) TaxID=675120 RepID=N1Q3N6_DOTSN|nr:hypothetical protein DOTSEDRAFT_68139 [Dothistroma septosporum NZE10]
MSTDRTTNRPLKPMLASAKTARTPLLTPRAAGNTTSTPSSRPAALRLPTTHRTPVTPRVKPQDDSNNNAALNVTPRSSSRKSRGSIKTSPSQEDLLSDSKPRSTLGVSDVHVGRSGATGAGAQGPGYVHDTLRAGRPRSTVGDVVARSPQLLRSPGRSDLGSGIAKDGIEAHFFHASDARKQEPTQRRPEPKKSPSFFYADGKEDKPTTAPRASSPVLSAVSEKRLSGPWTRVEVPLQLSKSPPMLSPSLASINGASPYFATAVPPHGQLRSPSPSKEHIHLSYRKGASQIFGTRPAVSPTAPAHTPQHDGSEVPRRPSLGPLHRKSTSLSSIDSGNSQQSRRRSATGIEPAPATSPLTQELKTIGPPRLASLPSNLPSIDTSLASPGLVGSPPQSMLSPTKNALDSAADARRERKVLDLEISNSSLLAINASLEREMRRQRAELKRFRRLSRAGRFSFAASDSRLSDALSTLGEEGDEDDDSGLSSRLADLQDDVSESEEEGSLMSGSEPLSPDAQASKEQDRLAQDEKRLRVDLERHKELLVQSQSMNQSLKRCMYATEEMIREGRKALEYNVRVSDVKLGGRILTGHDDEEIEVDDLEGDEIENAKGLFELWRGVGRLEGSEGSGDRDSGIEVDKPLGYTRASNTTNPADLGKSPEDAT